MEGLVEFSNPKLAENLKHNEFTEDIPVDDFLGDEKLSQAPATRRDFLKFLGFSTAAATIAALKLLLLNQFLMLLSLKKSHLV